MDQLISVEVENGLKMHNALDLKVIDYRAGLLKAQIWKQIFSDIAVPLDERRQHGDQERRQHGVLHHYEVYTVSQGGQQRAPCQTQGCHC